MTTTSSRCRAALLGIASFLFAGQTIAQAPMDAGILTEPAHISGPPIVLAERPTPRDAPRRACSFWAPVCVHGAVHVPEQSIEHVLRAAEKYYRVAMALGWPLPLSEVWGGDHRYDIYLLPQATNTSTISEWVPVSSAWDQSPAFTIMPPPLSPFGCDAEAAVARALAHASVLHLDAGAEDIAMAIAETHMADIVTDCSIATIAAIDDFQRRPERFLGYRESSEPVGAMLFGRFLDDTYGIGFPGGVLLSLLAVAGQRSPAGALHFANEPDLFDALRSNTKARGKPLEDLLLEFAIHRAFVGSRSDDGHLLDVSKFGDAGRVRFEWNLPYETLPRRLAPLRPIDAMGATYLWVDLRGAPENADLSFVADWEAGVLFHWAVVKVDAQGIEMGRISIAGIHGSTHAERSLVGLKGVAGLIVVGVNAGSIDRSRPFDPDDGELARSYTVTLIR